jgi:hypothetical protein
LWKCGQAVQNCSTRTEGRSPVFQSTQNRSAMDAKKTRLHDLE